MQHTSLETRFNISASRYASRPVLPAILWRLAIAMVFAVGSVVGLSEPKKAHAQGVFDMGVLTNTMSQGAIVQSERERARRMKSSKGGTTHTSLSGRTTRAAFTPSVAVRKRSIDRFIAGIRASDPQSAASLQKEFATKDIFGITSKQLSRYDLQTNSLTDAMTAYLITAWQAVHGDYGDPKKAQVVGVRKQIGQAFANIPALLSAPSAAKQEMADALLLQTMLISASVEGAKKKPEQMALVKSSVATGARATIGFDLASLRMTDKGLQSPRP